MWTTKDLGVACYQASGSTWCFEARGGVHGIGLFGANGTGDSPRVSLASVDDDRLPMAAEQFIRGDHWSINYPQGDGSYALRLKLLPISVTPDRLVLEVCISIQTDLLDTHPRIDVEVVCDDIDSIAVADSGPENDVQGVGSAPISLGKSKRETIAVLLGPHDRPFTTNHSSETVLRLRLFGEFLEKGVIRRARPWIVVDRGGDVATESELTDLHRQLSNSPLPLT